MRGKNIFAILDKNYVRKLFEEKKLVYFPDAANKRIKEIEIEKKSPEWAKETCLAKYKIIFAGGGFKTVRGTAGKTGSKRNAWRILNHLFLNGFGRGRERVARPLDFITELGLFLYEEAEGDPLTAIIRTGNIKKIKKCLESSAKWLAKLHKTAPPPGSGRFPGAIFLKAGDYAKTFAVIKKILPDLKNKLIPPAELGFINQISKEKKVLIHNDFYPGNIIFDGAVVCGIDFERSGLGFRLIDAATLLGWFEFPAEFKEPGFPSKKFRYFGEIFLEAFCGFSKMDYAKTRREVNKFLAKIFLDQLRNYALLAIRAGKRSGPAAKNQNHKKIGVLLQRVKNYI